MAMVSVFYLDWEMECCGTPFSVGDQVTWTVVGIDNLDDDERPVPAEAVTGALYAHSEHGGTYPGTSEEITGRVTRIQVVSQGFEAPTSKDHPYRRVPGDFAVRPVDTCPKWFRQSPETRQQTRDGRAYRQGETGVLVELDLLSAP